MSETFRPYEGTDPYIFISYSSQDRDQVLRVARTLREAGYRVWWDEGIHVSDEITEEIVEHIERCAVFLLFLSEASCGSDWCWKELRYAQGRKRPIAAVRIDPDLDLDRHRRFRFHLGDIHIDRAAPGDDFAAFVARLDRGPVFVPCKETPPDPVPPPIPCIPAIPWNRDDTIQWYLDGEGVLTIAKNKGLSSDGPVPMPDYEWDANDHASTAPWMQYREKIRSVVILDDIATIGGGAFRECRGLTRVTIPDSVTTIGHAAFNDCAGLTDVAIGGGVALIGDGAFFDCTGLTSVTIPAEARLGFAAFPDHTRIILR